MCFQIYFKFTFEHFDCGHFVHLRRDVEVSEKKILALYLLLMLLKHKCISQKSNAFKITLKGVESYCCFEIKLVKDNAISLIYSR